MMHNERLTLATICGGAVQEKVDRALGKVVENILDPNTDSEKKRTITLKITMKPNEHDYEDVNVTADVSYTLAPDLGVQTQFFVNKDLQDGHVTVMEHRRGEIRGQLDFGDIERMMEQQSVPRELDAAAREEDPVPDQEPEETYEDGKVTSVLDFRKKA